MSTVVVVDTSEVTREVIREHLESRGYRVVSLSDGDAALERVRRDPPSLLVAGVDLSGVDGYVLTRLVKEVRATIKVALLVDSGSERDRLRAFTAGADAVVGNDPESLEELLPLLEAATEGGAAARGGAADGGAADGGAAGDEAKISEDDRAVLERVSRRYDRELFMAEVVNRVWAIGERIQSLHDTAGDVLKTLISTFDIDIATVILLYEREARVFTLPGELVFEEDTAQFVSISRDDFSRRPGTEAVRSIGDHLLGTEEREDFSRVRIDGKRLSSYHTIVLQREDGSLIGTLHLGHLTNNYFTGRIVAEIERIARPVAVVLGNTVRYNETEDRRRKINTIFAKFVPEEVINDLLSQSEDAEMAVGEKRTVAILFSDIRSFTVISEHNSAETIVSFLNAYLERMVRIIRGHGGFIDKFIGDAILAIFGAPVSYEDNAARAIRAAREMAARVAEIDVEGLVLPEGGFATGIGVHEGTVIVGNIGSQDKFDYTVIGDNVNLASRLEGLTKHYHAQVLMSDVVFRKVSDEVEVREVDTVRVKGKEQATTLYMPVVPGSFDEESADDYRKALSMYKLGNWSTATDYFRRVLTRYPDDFLSSMYLQRCRDFAENPPDADWGGAIKLDFK